MLLASIANTALIIAEVAIGIGLLIFIHELGHFAVAKLMGVRVFKFSIGFGKRLVGFRRGETAYVLSALPLGGYVKFVPDGPAEQQTTDPRALVNQSAGRRALVFVAGATMNVIGALVMFIVAFRVGVEFVVSEVGTVHGGPAFEAGMREGDEILEVNGRRTRHFTDVRAAVALSDPSRDLHLVVRRDGERKTFTLRPRLDDSLQKGVPTIGIQPPLSTYVRGIEKDSVAEAAGLRPGDHILAIQIDTAPRKVLRTYNHLVSALQSAGDRPVLLEISSPDGVRRWQRVKAKRTVLQYGLAWHLGPVAINAVVRDSPATAAGLRRGDLVLAAGGKPVASPGGLVDIIHAHDNRPMSITVRRGEEECTLTVTPRVDDPDGGPKIGVSLGPATGAVPEVLHVDQGSALAGMEIPLGSVVLKVEETPCKTVGDVQRALAPILAKAINDPNQRVRLALRRPDGREVQKAVAPEPSVQRYDLGIEPKFKMQLARYGAGEACVVGLRKTVATLRQVLLTLRRILFTRSVKPGDAVVGPVQIPVIAYERAKSGFGDFVFLLAVLGANLAVINLLPIPILDGGQLMMLGIEKVKGSPLSERVQAVAQYVGLLVILVILGYILLQDLTKLIP